MSKTADSLITRRDAVLIERGVDPSRVIEVVEKRRADSKTFALGNGQMHVSKRLAPIHYRDAQGAWQDIDTDASAPKLPYIPVTLRGKVGYRHSSRSGGWMQMELVSIDGQPVTAPAPFIDEDKIVWPDIIPGVSCFLHLLRTHAEMFKVLDAPHSLEWRITSGDGFGGTFNERTIGRDARGDRLELITAFDGETYREEWTGRVSRRVDPRKRQKAWFDDPLTPVVVDASITENIGAGADDVWDYAGNLYDGSSEVVVGRSGASAPETTGLRFQTLAIPNGATVSAATLTVRVVYVDATPTTRIYGNDVDDAAAWSGGNLPGNITKTTAFTTWNPTSTGLKMLDVQSVVAEIIGRGGWASGNDLALGIFFEGTASGFEEVGIEAFEAAGTDEAQLDITYTEAPSGTTATITSLLDELTASLNAAQRDLLTIDADLDEVQASLNAAQPFTTTIASMIDEVQASLNVTKTDKLTIGATLDDVQASLNAAMLPSPNIAAMLDEVTASLNLDIVPPSAEVTVGATLDEVNASLNVVEFPQVTIAAMLDEVAAALAAEQQDYVTIASLLDEAQASLNIAQKYLVTIGATLDELTAALTLRQSYPFTIGATLDEIVASLAANQVDYITIAAVADEVQASLAIDLPFSITIDSDLDELAASLNAYLAPSPNITVLLDEVSASLAAAAEPRMTIGVILDEILFAGNFAVLAFFSHDHVGGRIVFPPPQASIGGRVSRLHDARGRISGPPPAAGGRRNSP